LAGKFFKWLLLTKNIHAMFVLTSEGKRDCQLIIFCVGNILLNNGLINENTMPLN